MNANGQMVMFEKEFREIEALIQRLNKEANTRVCYLVDKNGQLIASAGHTENIDATSLASLTAGNIAATSGLAKLLGEKEFSVLFHEGEEDHIHISLIGQRVIMVVIFDDQTSLGLVRLRVRKISQALTNIFNSLAQKAAGPSGNSPFRRLQIQI